MKEYKIEVIFWEDHYHVMGGPIPEDIDDVTPTLTVGIVLKETEKALVIAHDIEKYDTQTDISYSVILKQSIIGRKVFGKIKLSDIKVGVSIE